jgi:hypothetical protein
MKILTKEEEQAHYNATLRGGITGGTVGLIVVSTSTGFIRFNTSTRSSLQASLQSTLSIKITH